MSKTVVSLLLSIIISGCATTHPGTMAASNNKDVVVSVDRNDELSDKYYLFYEYTLENTTPEWKEVQVVNVHFDGQQTEVLTGNNLSAWIEGAELKLKASEYNRDLLLGSMVAAGGIAALSSSNTSVQTAGMATMAGSAAVAAGTQLSHTHSAANSGTKGENGTVNVPSTHVFVPSKIAPESYIRRWVVVRAPAATDAEKKTFSNTQYLRKKLIANFRVNGGTPVEYAAEVRSILKH